MDNQARQHCADIAKKDHEIEFLNNQHAALTQEYRELLEIKIELDMEIATYRTLLEGEEVQLGLSQTEDTSHHSETTLGRSKKRKRMMEEEYVRSMISTSFTQPGDLLIEPLEEDFKCIKVTNKGEMVNLNGFKMASTSDMQHYLKPYIPNIQAEQPIIINLGMPNYWQPYQISVHPLMLNNMLPYYKNIVQFYIPNYGCHYQPNSLHLNREIILENQYYTKQPLQNYSLTSKTSSETFSRQNFISPMDKPVSSNNSSE